MRARSARQTRSSYGLVDSRRYSAHRSADHFRCARWEQPLPADRWMLPRSRMLERVPCWSRGSGFPGLAQLGSAAQARLEVNGLPGGSRFIDALIVADVDATGIFDNLVLDDVDAESGRGR